MMRALVMLGGLVAVIAITVVGGQWLVPTDVIPIAHGLEVTVERVFSQRDGTPVIEVVSLHAGQRSD